MFKARFVVVLLLVGIGFCFWPSQRTRVEAMPTFAQAYGLDCSACHTQVPSLNAYGRYIQRTMYGALDPQDYKKVVPIWLGEQVNYDSSSSTNGNPPNAQFGNLAAHYVGVYSGVTSHIQQWIVQNNATGGSLDTAWVSYNHLISEDGHLVVGKMPAPGPSWFSQWFDVAPFAGPQMTIGQHTQLLSANRWGGKLSYASSKGVAEAGYYGSTGSLTQGVTDWPSYPDGKAMQYHVAFGNASKPVTGGIVGTFGNVPVINAATGFTVNDGFSALGAYVQTDPSGIFPGSIFYFQNGNDTNPNGDGFGAHSNAYSVELFAPLVAHREFATISVRREMTNDGLGGIAQYGYVNLGVRLAKLIHATGQMTFSTGNTPSFQYYIWFTPTLTGNVRM